MEEIDEIIDFVAPGASDGVALLAGFEGSQWRQQRRPGCIGRREGRKKMRFCIAAAVWIRHERSAPLPTSKMKREGLIRRGLSLRGRERYL